MIVPALLARLEDSRNYLCVLGDCMFLSEVVSFKPKAWEYEFREFPEYVSACPPLRSLPGIICNTSNIFEHVVDIANKVLLKKGDIIYPDMGSETPFFYLKKGKICIYNINKEGKVFTPHFIFHGSLIYDAFFITKGQFMPMPIKALEDSELYVFPIDLTFEDLLAINPLLVKNFSYSQAVKDLCYSKLSCINMYVKPLNRICIFIYEMYRLYQKKTFYPNITQSELALILNMHKVTMSNIITQLKEKNILKTFTKTELTIIDPDELIRLGSSE